MLTRQRVSRAARETSVSSFRMRTVLLANGRLGSIVAGHLAARGELAALVLHPPAARREGPAFEALGVPIHTWPHGLADVAALEPECLLSVLFGYRLRPEWLAIPSWLPVNLHPALLPWNGGSAPNAWPLVDGSPAGATLHVMADAIDAGDILAPAEVEVRADDTARTLYDRLEHRSAELFEEVWPAIREMPRRPQPAGGTSHRLADLAALDLTDDDLPTLDKLRARTFHPHGAEFERAGRRWRARVEIEPVEDVAD